METQGCMCYAPEMDWKKKGRTISEKGGLEMMNMWENVDVSLSIGIDIDNNQDIRLESQINMIR